MAYHSSVHVYRVDVFVGPLEQEFEDGVLISFASKDLSLRGVY